MAKRRKCHPPGPKGEGELFKCNDWWHWDGRSVNGLINLDDASELFRSILDYDEYSEFCRAHIGSMIFNGDKKSNKLKISRYNKCLKIIESKFSELEVRDENIIKGIIQNKFYKLAPSVFRDFLRILDFWGHPYYGSKIIGSYAKPGTLIWVDQNASTFVEDDHINAIWGSPSRFVVKIEKSYVLFNCTKEFSLSPVFLLAVPDDRSTADQTPASLRIKSVGTPPEGDLSKDKFTHIELLEMFGLQSLFAK